MDHKNQQLAHYTEGKRCCNFHIHHLSAQNNIAGLHRHDFFQIIFLDEGSGRQHIDFAEYDLAPRSVSVVFPHQIHRLDLSRDARATVIMFDETIFCFEMLRNELKDYNIDLQRKINNLPLADYPEAYAELMEFVAKIQTLCEDLTPARMMQVKLMIKILLLKIIDFFPDSECLSKNDADTTCYIRFREEVDLHFREQRKVQQYADMLGISVKKLTALTRHYAGMSPLEIIHEKRSLELEKAIALDDLTFKEVAARFGFSSQSALNKYIELKFGSTPLALKARLREGVHAKA